MQIRTECLLSSHEHAMPSYQDLSDMRGNWTQLTFPPESSSQ